MAADPRFEKNAALVCAHTGFNVWLLFNRTDHVAGDQARIPEMTLKIAAERFKTIQMQERTQHDPLWGIRTSGLLSMRQVRCVQVKSSCHRNGQGSAHEQGCRSGRNARLQHTSSQPGREIHR